MVINPVDNEVGEPWVLTLWFKQSTEQFETVLSEVVSENLEWHQSLVLFKRLGEQSQAEILDVVVGHINVDKTLIDRNGLSDSFSTIVWTLIIGEVETFKLAILTF